jgi:CheY-like chemotaxis protein
VGSPARVVVVDDHAGVRLGVVRLIGASPGFAVVGEAADGEEAVRLVARVHADVVLMDVSMPVLDGVSATRRVAALPPSVRPAVVLFTAWADRERMAGAMAAGASGYVLKDAPPAELLQALRDALAGPRPAVGPAAGTGGQVPPGASGPGRVPAPVIPITARAGARRWQARVAGGVAAMVILGSAGVAAAGQGALPAPIQAMARFVGLPTPDTRLDDARRALSRLDAALQSGDPAAIVAAVDEVQRSSARLDAGDRARLGAAPVLASAERRLTAVPGAGVVPAPEALAPDDHGGEAGPAGSVRPDGATGPGGGTGSGPSGPGPSGPGPSGSPEGQGSGHDGGSGPGPSSGQGGSSGPSPTTPATVAPSGGHSGAPDGGGGRGPGRGSSPSGPDGGSGGHEGPGGGR